eukprot:CAMPEP_0117756214 /NCGR_PEP_ID=MMETSP0947-20121206/13929_1 /TAXON_ID=44440 /ORGANISM="Chattonella subsalsa, Strain CCMP2191" /LENGTH=318 /DNA_ID=CAMNT_0005575727 /DNA_START=228 /DNA_END=1184 /DNA_ORIENTATION=-
MKMVLDEELLASAPQSFGQCIQQAQLSTAAAIKDGFRLIEVEFPPLPQDILDDASSSAEDITRANTRLAVDFAKYFAGEGKNVAILYPDAAEFGMAKSMQGTEVPFPNVKLHTIRNANMAEAKTIDGFVMGLFGKAKGNVQIVEDCDMYIAVIFSAQELPELEDLASKEPNKPIIFFNLKLDVQRGDLGLLGFPSKDLHFRFLSQIMPAYYLRPRSYARSLPRPPYLLSYQGALFRAYPGGFQSLLDKGTGSYRRVALADTRPALGEFKEQLNDALEIDIDEKGNKESEAVSFFRTGYKTATWWEEPNDKEESTNWRK